MAKSKTVWVCQECGDHFPVKMGKCPSCGVFDSLKAFHPPSEDTPSGARPGRDLLVEKNTPTDTPTPALTRLEVGEEEWDRVLGGGLVPGSLVLLGGEPGIGKSTLALRLAISTPESLYFSAEESAAQVQQRGTRLKPMRDDHSGNLQVVHTHSLEDIQATIRAHTPTLVVVDSVQLISNEEKSSGTMQQIRTVAETLLRVAKETNTIIILIGHVTKEGQLAGPRMLEHLVDVVLTLQGDRYTDLRLLRSPKNRFGSTLEVGLFHMKNEGLVAVANPAAHLMSVYETPPVGSAVTVVQEGRRSFPLELQALTVQTNFGLPRRTANGVELGRLHVLLAVLQKYTPWGCEAFDVYINLVGGLRVKDPSLDLGICGALLSSRMEKPCQQHTVWLGEVGLTGEIRPIPNANERLAHLHKLGIRTVLGAPALRPHIPDELDFVPVAHVGVLMKAGF